MAIRSPSPNPSRSKTPDSNNNLPKSKEIPPKSSVPKSLTPGSSSLRSSFEQKENLKSRSPSISSCSKGSKNFMAPTISAASKVISASPRKKVLQEMNEVINSTEFLNKEESADGDIEDVGSKSEMEYCSKEESSRPKKFQNLPPLSQIVPLDADPSLPPYDPKTNYLSPRPQFLHYRPNPRIEHYLSREGEFLDVGDGRKLEDSFSWEGSEDDVTPLTDEKDSEEGGESFHSDVEEPVSENETQFVLEPEPEIEIKPLACRPYRRSKMIPFLLVLVLASMYASLSDSPVNVNLNGFYSRIKHWPIDSIAYFSYLKSPPKGDVGLYHLFNMAPLAADESIGFDHSYKHEIVAEQSIKETGYEVPEIVKDGHVEANAEGMEKEALDENTEMEHREDEAENIETSVSEDAKEDDIGAQQIEIEVSEGVTNANVVGSEMEKEMIEHEGQVKVEVRTTEMEPETVVVVGENYNDANSIAESAELEHDLSHLSDQAPNFEEELDNNDIAVQSDSMEVFDDASYSDNPSEFDKEFQTSPGLALLKSTNYGTMLGFSLALASLVLVSTLVFLYKNPKQIPTVRKETQATKKTDSVSGSTNTYTIAKGVIGDSGLKEVSSGLKNTLRKREGDEEERNLSNDRRLGRDSTDSSSISYGSFTTYERRSAKKGSKEEEVVTPVRRSSRIRHQLTSP